MSPQENFIFHKVGCLDHLEIRRSAIQNWHGLEYEFIMYACSILGCTSTPKLNPDSETHLCCTHTKSTHQCIPVWDMLAACLLRLCQPISHDHTELHHTNDYVYLSLGTAQATRLQLSHCNHCPAEQYCHFHYAYLCHSSE